MYILDMLPAVLVLLSSKSCLVVLSPTAVFSPATVCILFKHFTGVDLEQLTSIWQPVTHAYLSLNPCLAPSYNGGGLLDGRSFQFYKNSQKAQVGYTQREVLTFSLSICNHPLTPIPLLLAVYLVPQLQSFSQKALYSSKSRSTHPLWESATQVNVLATEGKN